MSEKSIEKKNVLNGETEYIIKFLSKDCYLKFILTQFFLEKYFWGFSFKGIVSWDFDGLFMILSYSLDVRQVPPQILFFKFYLFIFKLYHLWWCGVDPSLSWQPWFGYRIYTKHRPTSGKNGTFGFTPHHPTGIW
jgi:hypothetical protein